MGWSARAPKPVRQVFLAVKSEDSRSLVQTKRVRGSVLEWRGSYGFVKPEGKVHHPEASKGRIYLHRSDLREPNEEPTVGAQVDFQVYADPKGLGAMDCRVLAEADQEEEPLPAGWTEVWSEEHSEWYYWHSATKESSWTRPGREEEEAEEELPDGWEKAFDAERGLPYFWHRPTKTASWERPGTEEEVSKNQPAEPQPAEEASMDDEVLAKQRLTGRIVKWTGISGWLKPQAGADHLLLKTDQDKVYLSWRDLQPGLAPEVGMLVDFALAVDDSGLRAVDVSTEGPEKAEEQKRPWKKKPRRETTVDPLAILQKEWAKQDAELGEAQDEDEEEAPAEAKEEAADEDAAEGPLLPGWEEQWSEEHQCRYYWHRKTAQSSWERPSLPGVGTEVKAESQAEEAEREGSTKEATPMTPLVTTSGRSMTPITPTVQARTPSAVSKGRAAEAARILRMQGKPVGPTPSPGGVRPVRPVAAVRPAQPAGRPPQVLRWTPQMQPRPTFLPAAKRPRIY